MEEPLIYLSVGGVPRNGVEVAEGSWEVDGLVDHLHAIRDHQRRFDRGVLFCWEWLTEFDEVDPAIRHHHVHVPAGAEKFVFRLAILLN